MIDPRAFLIELFEAAVAAAAPERVVAPHLPARPRGRVVVVGAGKAAAAMARAVEREWPDVDGLVVTRYGHGVDCRRIEVVEAGHPLPDGAGLDAAREVLRRVAGLGPEDLVLCLLSGGGSALWTAPIDGVPLEEKRAVTRGLLRSGAPIAELNCVRKHLSAIKGGRLAAAAAPAAVHALLISDVAGDDPSVIASGPTVGDPTTADEARAVLARRGVPVPPAVARALAAHETPKPDDPRLARSTWTLVATPAQALRAAADRARARGVEPVLCGAALEGEASALAVEHARAALATALAPRPRVLLSGGEATVVVRGDGRGGPNGEYALALARALAGAPGVWALAADTDGVDGTEDNAGCLVAPDTLARAAAVGLDAERALAANDSHAFFRTLGDLLHTGPTRTNVNDFRAILLA